MDDALKCGCVTEGNITSCSFSFLLVCTLSFFIVSLISHPPHSPPRFTAALSGGMECDMLLRGIHARLNRRNQSEWQVFLRALSSH